LFGDTELDRYYEAQVEFDKTFGRKGARCRITCPQGSDFTFDLAKPIFEKPRRATKPGMYTIPGACSIGADSKTIKGRIVLGAVFHHSYELLPQPVTVEVDGAIKSITGAGAAAIKFGQAVRRATAAKDGMIIHLTNGLHPTAAFTGKCFNEDMRALGNNAVGFGLPWWEPGGGENHPDGIIVGQSVWIDNELIVENGRVVGGSEELVRKADALVA
jgi:2,5-dihydroxypyridine 5,6-dioxygenase